MAHMDRISMGGIHGVHAVQFQARARAPDLVLPPRETPRRYASMAQKEALGASVRAYKAQMPMFEHPIAHPTLPGGVAPAHSLICVPQLSP